MYPVCNQLINYIENKTYNLGIYPGSFNPFHIGHLNIVHQAEKIFDKVIVAKGCNIPKTNKEFHLNGFNLLHYEVDEYSNLLTQYLEKFKNMNCKFSLIRGLRNSFDVNYENNFKKAIYDLTPEVNFIYIFCDKEFEHISSSLIRSLQPFGKESYQRYLV